MATNTKGKKGAILKKSMQSNSKLMGSARSRSLMAWIHQDKP
jgi:hypothetical protein